MTHINVHYEAGFMDTQADALYLADGAIPNANVVIWDGGLTDMTYTWRSKVFRLNNLHNFSCAQVLADTYPVTCNVYADGVLRHTQNVTSSEMFRLPGGFLARDWEVELTGTGRVQTVIMADSVDEVRSL